MLSYHSNHPDGRKYCCAEYHETEHWLHVTWKGLATTPDSQRGATDMLRRLQLSQVPYLLNDNTQVQGPWFDSVAWLQSVWAPQAARLGLRYVAHVLQPHTEDDLGLLLLQNPFAGKFELQFFMSMADATSWLRDCQRLDAQCELVSRPSQTATA